MRESESIDSASGLGLDRVGIHLIDNPSCLFINDKYIETRRY
jgi:hypothetical protein